MYFDAGQQLYLYALGPSHPYLSIHLNALADCYVKSKRFSHAKVRADRPVMFSYLLYGSDGGGGVRSW